MAGLLYAADGHKNVQLDPPALGCAAMPANLYLIVDGDRGMILDPGGNHSYGQALRDTQAHLGQGQLSSIFLSHQDPDVVAAINGWLLATQATAYISQLWMRFVPHFGLDALLLDRLSPIPDSGMALALGCRQLLFLPAHFLHSPGNFQVYDPTSRILFSGDLGASIGAPWEKVDDFDAHIPYMVGFHQRYLASNRTLRRWVAMVRELDIEVIAPQHGALLIGRPLVERFLDWCLQLPCGVDLLDDVYRVPK